MAEKSWRFLVFLLRIGLGLLIMLAWFQRSLIYHPAKTARLLAANSELPQAVVDLSVTTHDDLTLNGWLALAGEKKAEAAPNVSASLKQGRPLVIVFPGNAGNRSMRQYLLQALGSLGADVLIFDHRGFGDNPGKPTEAHLIRDARSIWDHATGELQVSPQRIVLYGESLGGGVATRLARDLCDDGIEPGGLIVQASFDSLVSVGKYHFPVLPVSLLLIDRMESARHITQVACPYLHLHGRHDAVVPLALGQTLFQAAPEKSSSGVPKQLLLLPNTNHNDVYGPDRKLVLVAVEEFLGRLKR